VRSGESMRKALASGDPHELPDSLQDYKECIPAVQ
jgi:hypothetical protein